MEQAPVLVLQNISKRFGNLLANDDISITLHHGEVLALLGENGAGKTTLMSILFGNYVADSGTITAFGKPLPKGSTRAALAAGIGMVQQHFSLADNLSVLDNIIAGSEPLLRWRQQKKQAVAKINQLAQQCGFNIDIHAAVHSLSVGERQKVEILKVLYRGAKILILDEPTAVLTPQEADALFLTVKKLVQGGLSVILISHKLNEIMQVSHRICVLRHGKLTYEAITANASPQELAHAMVGREITRKEKSSMTIGAPLLQLKKVQVKSKPNNLILHECEILGITGVSGNGQEELSDILNGLEMPAAGELLWYGQAQTPAASELTALQVARIPADRGHVGVVGDMSIAENLISNCLDNFCRHGFFDFKKINLHAKKLLRDYDVRYQSVTAPARLLSGGNMQKLILARELSPTPKIIIANQPTRGLDVGAINDVHRQLLTAKENGSGVLLLTEDLDELFALSDQVAVMFSGALSEFHPADKINIRQIGLMMSGAA
ncbi:MAG: ABC transporter ATP-binding protein [Proteobacteria bacterium]|nr:ABC transporter ATP-binding protein [Pseudomonadota bacterium]